MENDNLIKIKILNGTMFLNSDGTFEKTRALNYCGKIAGICYNKEDFKQLENEKETITEKRIKQTLDFGHHSVYDHVIINFYLENIPKILAMFLNNEKQYTTSEKSARYTPIIRKDGSIITQEEENLYNKWMDIFKVKIKKDYGYIYDDKKIEKLAQENSRYLVTVFAPTQMVYSTTFRQINYIVSWMNELINNKNNNELVTRLVPYMQEFVQALEKTNVLEERLQKNEKSRKLSLLVENITEIEHFGDTYTTNYKGSFAQLAQAQRHRTLDYKMSLMEKPDFFTPPILMDEPTLVEEWLKDISSVSNVYPQGELVVINETGKYEDFILKCKERLCSSAQLEICNQTRETLLKYKEFLNTNNHPLKDNIVLYSKGARCTFPDYNCASDCGFKKGKVLSREI